jgi:hypothetical protein
MRQFCLSIHEAKACKVERTRLARLDARQNSTRPRERQETLCTATQHCTIDAQLQLLVPAGPSKSTALETN